MAKVGLTITKECQWRNQREEFSNTYHYDGPAVDEAIARNMLTLVKAAERQVHSTAIEFKQGRVWSAGGTAAENQTIVIVDFADFGAATDEPSMDREACYLINFRTNRPSATGRPVTLKKFIHACSMFGLLNEETLSGRGPLDQGAMDDLKIYGDAIKNLLVSGGTYLLSAPNSTRTAGATQVFPYIEHHEFT